MPTVAEVLRGRIGLDIACVDRVLLNRYDTKNFVSDTQASGHRRLVRRGDRRSQDRRAA